MDEAHDGTRSADEPEIDRSLLQLWPAPLRPDEIIRRGSRNADYWHGVAASTAAPPPPPSAAGLSAREADEEWRTRALRAQQEAREAEQCGRAPTDELRAIGGRAHQLARLDRDLVELPRRPPRDRQRDLALWAARQACDVAGIAHPDRVRTGPATAARGGPPPEPWHDWHSAWKRLFPPAGEAVVDLRVTASRGRPAHQPLAPEATAIDAVREAGGADPAMAVMGALDALARGHERPRTVAEDIRGRLRTGDF
jgi:hypothetical protein